MHPDNHEPTGDTGDRNQPPTLDLMADYLETWDTVTNHPRDKGEYMALAAVLLALDEQPGPAATEEQ
jgi:hypothetical protein